jgi:hypothetical protein
MHSIHSAGPEPFLISLFRSVTPPRILQCPSLNPTAICPETLLIETQRACWFGQVSARVLAPYPAFLYGPAYRSRTALSVQHRRAASHDFSLLSSPELTMTLGWVGCVSSPHTSPSLCDCMTIFLLAPSISMMLPSLHPTIILSPIISTARGVASS